jgi:hypothetical protein
MILEIFSTLSSGINAKFSIYTCSECISARITEYERIISYKQQNDGRAAHSGSSGLLACKYGDSILFVVDYDAFDLPLFADLILRLDLNLHCYFATHFVVLRGGVNENQHHHENGLKVYLQVDKVLQISTLHHYLTTPIRQL